MYQSIVQAMQDTYGGEEGEEKEIDYGINNPLGLASRRQGRSRVSLSIHLVAMVVCRKRKSVDNNHVQAGTPGQM